MQLSRVPFVPVTFVPFIAQTTDAFEVPVPPSTVPPRYPVRSTEGLERAHMSCDQKGLVKMRGLEMEAES